MRPVKFSRSSRRHKIGKAHALAAMEDSGEPTFIPATDDLDERWTWTGRDDRGVELHIIALDKPDGLLVIHVQPTSYEHQTPNDTAAEEE